MSSFFKIHFNIILPFASRSRELFLPVMFSTKISYAYHLCPMLATLRANLYPPRMNRLDSTYGELYKSRSSSLLLVYHSYGCNSHDSSAVTFIFPCCWYCIDFSCVVILVRTCAGRWFVFSLGQQTALVSVFMFW
jgi:hypothetical protein